ncbi:MAG: hypothetical protein R2702_05755 [Acidimicrobiales bacterium]
MRRPVIALLLAAALLSACGGGGGSDDDASGTTAPTASALPEACASPPVAVDLRAGGDHPAGSEAFEATQAVALRTPILPGELAFDGASLSAAQSKAEITPLAAYSLYLSDFEVDREVLRGRGLGQVVPPAGKTVGVLSLVPPDEAGLAPGTVVTDGELGYDTNTTFAPLSLVVISDGDATAMAHTDVTGQAEVLALDDEQLCVAFDVAVEDDGELVYAGKGTVVAPVVRSDPAFFFT